MERIGMVFLGLGSNMGDRQAHIDAAVAGLNALPGTTVIAVATPIETDPVGGPEGQDRYLNSACAVETSLSPEALLEAVQRIEQEQGRDHGDGYVQWGPRPLDIDILLWDDVVRADPVLTIPHPRMAEREFVLVPLAGIAPDAIHPVNGRIVGQLLGALQKKQH